MTAAHRRMAARQSSPCKLLIIVLYANREHRRDAYATLGSATCLTPWPPTVQRPAATLPTPGQRGLLLVGRKPRLPGRSHREVRMHPPALEIEAGARGTTGET